MVLTIIVIIIINIGVIVCFAYYPEPEKEEEGKKMILCPPYDSFISSIFGNKFDVIHWASSLTMPAVVKSPNGTFTTDNR